MTLDEERDLAVLARREANAMRRRQYERDFPRCACPDEDCREPARDGSRFCWDCSGAADGPPDSYWSDTGGESPTYRRDMRDAGRGSMLR